MDVTSITDPSQRLDRIQFDPRKESIEHAIHFGFYHCPQCAAKTRFERKDFSTGPGSKISSFHREIFDRFPLSESMPPLAGKSLDFYCPGCNLAVRIIYENIEFAMGAYYFNVIQILELSN